jgi:DNA-binding response OmpR family regulator
LTDIELENKIDLIRVMIVEDESIPATYLKNIIEEQGDFAVECIVPSAEEALSSIKKIKPNVVFVDIMLDGPMSGAELALRIHRLYEKTLIIFMTAYSNEEMVEFAVESEAFAYLLKPYRPKEIRATLTLAKARLKRYIPIAPGSSVNLIDGFSYSIETKRLYKEGREVELSAKELELIGLLCGECYTVVDSEMILEQMGITATSLRAIIYRIRKDTSSDLIQSVKRLGYRIATSVD